jgi:hypothetical protein
VKTSRPIKKRKSSITKGKKKPLRKTT